MSRIQIGLAIHTNELWHTYEKTMSHVQMRHVTHMNASCHTYECVLPHKRMSNVTRTNDPHSNHKFPIRSIYMCIYSHQKYMYVCMYSNQTFWYIRIRRICMCVCSHQKFIYIYVSISPSEVGFAWWWCICMCTHIYVTHTNESHHKSDHTATWERFIVYLHKVNESCRTTMGVVSIDWLLKIIDLFCKRALWKRLYSAKETCNLKEPTNRSHPIRGRVSNLWCIRHIYCVFCWRVYIRVTIRMRHVTRAKEQCHTHENVTSYTWMSSYTAVCCSVLQCVAMCCSVLQCEKVTAYTWMSHVTHLRETNRPPLWIM